MPTYLTPGVYFGEIGSSGRLLGAYDKLDPAIYALEARMPGPRWWSEHSTAAFLGVASQGPLQQPMFLSEWQQFGYTFGDFVEGAYLAHAVHGFFNNGGRSCYVVRIGGSAEVGVGIALDDFIGGMAALEAIQDISTVCVPDIMSAYERGMLDLDGLQAIQLGMIDHCHLMGDRVAILDPPPGLHPQQVKEWRVDRAGYDSEYAALYYPWIKVYDPASGHIFVPPSGHIAGIFARSDLLRGFHRAPANQTVQGALALDVYMLHKEQELLYPAGVNLLVASSTRGLVVWGARTLSSDPTWRDLQWRRVAIFIQRNIRQGTQWVVFERTDDTDVWARVLHDLADFFHLLWRSGVLWGDTPEQAYALRCDEETNPAEARIIVVEVSVALQRYQYFDFQVVYSCG